jgi:phosphatidylglycerophosphate synthase
MDIRGVLEFGRNFAFDLEFRGRQERYQEVILKIGEYAHEDALSWSRALLVPLILWTFYLSNIWLSLVLSLLFFTAAAFSDALDGEVARAKRRLKRKLCGEAFVETLSSARKMYKDMLDGGTDKILILIVGTIVSAPYVIWKIRLWLIIVEAGGLVLLLLLHAIFGEKDHSREGVSLSAHNMPGKIKMVVECILIYFCLFTRAFPCNWHSALTTLYLISIILSISSTGCKLALRFRN